ncbi:hypothetical protein RMSM_01277 [Rhodopirellula maiorica SM1]|uniref:GEVED domain-containing protein n=1 Tax=Rhodopirellula maiorica SM1 TaxID=1265738 RepID=M5RRI1_9BACT|nr:GEVED domain-containing protein [Rhodopirellula maiorica]EMI21801.1 hypothetical protein RMSM_01277 [Rhodopirellula maiorica SM1]
MFGVIGLASSVAAVNIDLQNADVARVDAWLDFDGNATWDATDQILDSVPVVAGLQTLNFAIPDGAVVGNTYARIRVSTAGDLDPSGTAIDGEVEDYVVALVADPAPIVERVVINDDSSNRSNVTEVAVVFDRV